MEIVAQTDPQGNLYTPERCAAAEEALYSMMAFTQYLIDSHRPSPGWKLSESYEQAHDAFTHWKAVQLGLCPTCGQNWQAN